MASRVRRARCLLMHLETHDMLIDGTTEHTKPKESAMGAINAAGDSFKQIWSRRVRSRVANCTRFTTLLCAVSSSSSAWPNPSVGGSANQTLVEQAKAVVTSGTGIGTKHSRFGHNSWRKNKNDARNDAKKSSEVPSLVDCMENMTSHSRPYDDDWESTGRRPKSKT